MSKPDRREDPGQAEWLPVYWLGGIRHGDGVNLIQAFLCNVGTCRSDEKGRNSSGGPTRMSVPMRRTGAVYLVVVVKSL